MTTTIIGSVPFWDSYYGESTPQNWSTDGTYLYDSNGVAVAPINSLPAQSASGAAAVASSLPSWLIPGAIAAIVLLMLTSRR